MVRYGLAGAGVVLLAIAGFGWYQSYAVGQELAATESARSAVAEKASALESELAELRTDYAELEEAYSYERTKNETFEERIEQISETVYGIEKYVETDPELLRKYSRIYFLNEHYSPESLRTIPDEYVHGSRDIQFHGKVWPFLNELLAEASNDDMKLKAYSGYRSFGTQAALKARYTVTYGSGADTFSADQGYSEHQLGTTLDFTTASLGDDFTSIEETPEFEWLQENAHRFGFVLSYPEDNAYYVYEPWHWRFVGIDLATFLHENGKRLYDLDQRTLDEYLDNFYDN